MLVVALSVMADAEVLAVVVAPLTVVVIDDEAETGNVADCVKSESAAAPNSAVADDAAADDDVVDSVTT